MKKPIFWHIGVNKTKEDNSRILIKDHHLEYRAPRINPDGGIECKLLPDHADPDFPNRTYGEPWGRIDQLDEGDVAFFIESGTGNEWKTWGFYVVAIFVTEAVYRYRNGNWLPRMPKGEHMDRVSKNVHFSESKEKYAILLGERGEAKSYSINHSS